MVLKSTPSPCPSPQLLPWSSSSALLLGPCIVSQQVPCLLIHLPLVTFSVTQIILGQNGQSCCLGDRPQTSLSGSCLPFQPRQKPSAFQHAPHPTNSLPFPGQFTLSEDSVIWVHFLCLDHPFTPCSFGYWSTSSRPLRLGSNVTFVL